MSSPSRRFAAPAAVAALALALSAAAPALASPATPASAPATASAAAAEAAETPKPVINEIESNGDDTDWVEFGNPGTEPLDLSGYVFTDAEPAKKGHTYTLPSGSVVAPGGLLVIDQVQASRPGFDFGLGSDDAARLYAPGTDVAAPSAVPVVEHSWGPHASVTYGRCPDLTGSLADTTRSTKGAPNDCSSPFVINEIESDGGDPDDWVELYNTGAAAVSANGLVLTDAEPDKAGHRYTITGTEPVPAGGFLRLDTATFGFGLGKADAVRLLGAGDTVIDEYAWSAHAATSYGRCPDGSGDFATTKATTPGAANDCGSSTGPAAQAWPGGESVRTLDAADETRGDFSGLDQEPGKPGQPGGLWAVQNGDGELYRYDSTDAGTTWERTRGWELRYADGSGTVDAEGVTVTGAGSAGGVFVSTERDNDNKGVSRPAVLRFDVPASATGSAPVTAEAGTPVLNASAEWNLAADFPGLGANAGLEGVTWIPDRWLTDQGILDESTGSAYSPAAYPGHGEGLFAVAVEGTGHVYLYALMDSGAFQRVADIPTGLDVVADVQFDADRGQVWAVCDDACNGRIAILTPQPSPEAPATPALATAAAAAGAESRVAAEPRAAAGATSFAPSALYERPAQTANFGNEGFVVSDLSQCTAGTVPTYYADDNNTDGHSLRAGTLNATCPTVEPEPTESAEPTEEPGADAGSDGGAAGSADGTGADAEGSASAGSDATAGADGSGTAGSEADAGSDADADGAATQSPGTDPSVPAESSSGPANDSDAGAGAGAGAEGSDGGDGAPVNGAQDADDDLAATGANALPWLAAGVALALAGGLLLTRTARRRH